MTQEQTIPFHLELKRLFDPPHVFHHELTFGVVGTDQPARVVIASDCYANPRITARQGKGGIELEDALVDKLAIASFKLVASEIMFHSGESGWWSIDNLTKFIHKQFEPQEAQAVMQALSLQVKDGVTAKNICMVADDDAI